VVIKNRTKFVSRKQLLGISIAVVCFALALLPFYFLYWKCVFSGYPQPSTAACLAMIAFYLIVGLSFIVLAFRKYFADAGSAVSEGTLQVPRVITLVSKGLLLLSVMVALYLMWFGFGFSALIEAQEVTESRTNPWLATERRLFGDQATAGILNGIATGRLNNHKSNNVTLWCLLTAQAIIKDEPNAPLGLHGDLSNNLGRAYEIEGDNDAALRSYFDTVIALAPHRDHDTEYALYVAACKIGARTAALGNYEGAVSAYKLALGTDTARENPGIAAPIRAQFALALQNNREYSKAEEQYRLAIRHAEDGPASWSGKREDLRTCQSTMSYAALLGHYEDLLVVMGKKDQARAVREKLQRYLAVGAGK
jgi:tetratricopeptide (TPR) repeat protein